MTDSTQIKKRSSHLWWNLLLCALLTFATILVYWQVRNHSFIGFDDQHYVTENYYVQHGLTSESLFWSFSSSGHYYWHPLTWLSHIVDYQFYGLNPAGHHLTNLLFHLLSTILLFLTLQSMTRARWKSAFVAALFALHPLNVESVAWLAERKSVLSTFFWMLTMLTYLHYCKRPSHYRYLLVFLSYALGLMAKPMLVTLPFVLLLLDLWPLERLRFGEIKIAGNELRAGPVGSGSVKTTVIPLLLEKVPLLALAGLSGYLTSLSATHSGMIVSTELVPMKLRIGNALVSYVNYLAKMILPFNLAVFYPFPKALPLWQPVGAALLLVMVSVLVFHFRSKRGYLAVGWLWYLGTLVPVIGLKQVGLWPAIADRWGYLPLIGIFIIIAWAVEELVEKYRYGKRIVAVVAGVILLASSALTWKQLHHWRNTISLFQHAIQVTKSNYVAHTNVGYALMEQGKLQNAISHLTLAVEIEPTFPKAHGNLGNCLARVGKHDQAVVHLYKALQYEPNSAGIHNNLGNVLEEQGKIREALRHYYSALQLDPWFAEAHFNLGTLRARQGRNQQALAHFSETLRLRPDFAPAHNSIGAVLARQGKIDDAIYHFKEAVRLEPELRKAHTNLQRALEEARTQDKSLSVKTRF